jgi:hypothetical protein
MGVGVGESNAWNGFIQAFGYRREIFCVPLLMRGQQNFPRKSRTLTVRPAVNVHLGQVNMGVIQEIVTLSSAIVENAVAFRSAQARPKYPWANH